VGHKRGTNAVPSTLLAVRSGSEEARARCHEDGREPAISPSVLAQPRRATATQSSRHPVLFCQGASGLATQSAPTMVTR
jgi:hypothetical protein